MTLLLEDVYQVVGRSELPFEDALRERYVGKGAVGAPGRLALATWVPHGGGEGYEAVTLVEVEDGDELDAYIRWSDSEAGVAWMSAIQGMCHSQQSTVQQLRLGDFSRSRSEIEGTTALTDTYTPLYRLDRLSVANPDLALKYLSGRFPTDDEASGDDASNEVTPVAVWSPLLSVAAGRSLSVLYRFAEDGFRRAWERSQDNEGWTGELSVEHISLARKTKLLRTAKAVSAAAEKRSAGISASTEGN